MAFSAARRTETALDGQDFDRLRQALERMQPEAAQQELIGHQALGGPADDQ